MQEDIGFAENIPTYFKAKEEQLILEECQREVSKNM